MRSGFQKNNLKNHGFTHMPIKRAFQALIITGLVLIALPVYSSVEVDEIIGGDVYRLNTGEEVRLAGVDTNAIRKPGKRGKEFVWEALGYIANLFSTADIEIVDSGLPRDKENRRKVYIYLIETRKKIDMETYLTKSKDVKTLLNLEIIRRGYGKVKRGYKGDYKKSFKTAQKQAKEKKVGLWRS